MAVYIGNIEIVKLLLNRNDIDTNAVNILNLYYS